jgi:chitinase
VSTGWREKSLCCTANQETLNKPICDADLCEVDPELCRDPDADEPDYEPGLYDLCLDNPELCKPVENEKRDLHKRGPGMNLPGARIGVKHFAELALGLPQIAIPFPSYPSKFGDLLLEKGQSLATLAWPGGIKMANDVCLGSAVTYVAAANMKKEVDHYTKKIKGMRWNTEHLFEVSIRYAVLRYYSSQNLDVHG